MTMLHEYISFFQHTCQSHIECIGLRCPRLPTCGFRGSYIVRMSLLNLTHEGSKSAARVFLCLLRDASKSPPKVTSTKKKFEFLSMVTPKTVQGDPKVLPTSSPKWPQNDPNVTPKWPQSDHRMTPKWLQNDLRVTPKQPLNYPKSDP